MLSRDSETILPIDTVDNNNSWSRSKDDTIDDDDDDVDDEIDGDGFSDRDDDREEKNVHFNSFQISRLFYGLVKKWAKTKEQKKKLQPNDRFGVSSGLPDVSHLILTRSLVSKEPFLVLVLPVI